mmetsp:Transcript_67298/g.217253  ORF Transcript_67298/g.217253 Transcript_67298/m.217253 type:complete len:342 (+) Transcript_67298:1410-2435(+)
MAFLLYQRQKSSSISLVKSSQPRPRDPQHLAPLDAASSPPATKTLRTTSSKFLCECSSSASSECSLRACMLSAACNWLPALLTVVKCSASPTAVEGSRRPTARPRRPHSRLAPAPREGSCVSSTSSAKAVWPALAARPPGSDGSSSPPTLGGLPPVSATRCSVSDCRDATELPRLVHEALVERPRSLEAKLSRRSRYVMTCPLPFISIWPRCVVVTHSGSSLWVSVPNWSSPGKPFCIIRAAVLIVSPNSRNRGSLFPMTPATTGPVWIPIFKITSSLDSEETFKISEATRISRPRISWWPCFSSSSTSAGTTPTAQTYSSPTVSILVTSCLAQMLSKRVK